MARGFNGSSSSIISVADAANLRLSSGSFSVSIWIYQNSFSNYQNAIGKIGSGNGSGWGIITFSTGDWNLQVLGSNVGNVDPGVTMSNGTWNHLCVTYDGTYYRLYTNGTLNTTSFPATNTTSATSPLVIGGDTLNSRYWNGRLAEFAIWSGAALTAGEVAALATGALPYTIQPIALASGIYLPLWGLASPEPDMSGNANNGTLTGTTYANHPPVNLFLPPATIQYVVSSPPPPPVVDQLPWLRHPTLPPDTMADPGRVNHFQVWLSPTPNYYDGLPWHHPPIYGVQPLPEVAGRVGGWQPSFTPASPPPPPPVGDMLPWRRHVLPQYPEVPPPPIIGPIQNTTAIFYSPAAPPPIPPGNPHGRSHIGLFKPQIARDPTQDSRQRRASEVLSQAINSLMFQGFLYQTNSSTWALTGVPFVVNRAPTIFDDTNTNVEPGQLWLDTANGALYVNLDSTNGAAVWKQITLT